MKKIIIIGSCGAGKSTLAKQLHQATGVPLIHLDTQYWSAGWVEPTKAAWEQKVKTLVAQPGWIMDGNFGGTMPIRMARADTIIYLDRSRWLCLFRVLRRVAKNYGKTRSDMAAGCPERFS